MARTALVQARVSEETKVAADELFEELGLDTATAIRMFLAHSIQAGGLPFQVWRQPRYNAVTEAAMAEGDAIAEGRTHAPGYQSFGEYRKAIGI